MKRRWFQIHLSTAILMMLAAGTLLGMNLMTRHTLMPGEAAQSRGDLRKLYRVHSIGWPFIAYNGVEDTKGACVFVKGTISSVGEIPNPKLENVDGSWDWIKVFYNTFFSLLLISFVGWVCEKRIRRRRGLA